ncbi:TPA: DUF1627 domain-containing protein [Salmonella enterica]
MESVLDALKAMGKATAREIAARMAIEPRDALEMLNEQQEIGTVKFLNGYWLLSGIAPVPTKAVKRNTPRPEAAKDIARIGELQMLDTIREHGPQTAEDLAALFGITSRKVTSTLAMATRKGRLNRVKRDGKFCYCMPEVTSAPEAVLETENASAEPEPVITPDATSAIDASTESDTVQVDDKTALVLTESHQGSLTLPTPKEISRVIRKLRRALHQAEQVRESVIAAKKHEKTLKRMARLLQELQQ